MTASPSIATFSLRVHSCADRRSRRDIVVTPCLTPEPAARPLPVRFRRGGRVRPLFSCQLCGDGIPMPLAIGPPQYNRIESECVPHRVVEAHRNRTVLRRGHEDAGVEALYIEIASIHEVVNHERQL